MSRTIFNSLIGILLAFVIACADDGVTAPRPVASITVSPAANTVVIGQTATLAATVKDASGAVLTGRSIQWSTSNGTIATVSAAGLVTAIAEGTATITATSEGKTGQAQITVSPVPVASVRLTPLTVVIDAGGTRQLTAVALDAAGNALQGRTIQWSTDAPGVATVSAAGLVQAITQGYAVITASIEGKTASSAFTVTEPEPAEQFDLLFERRAFNGLGGIWRLSPSTGTAVTVPLVMTVPGTLVRDATPSPDGQRIAFTVAWYPDAGPFMEGDVYVANIDGTNVRRLTSEEGLDDQAAWSPDGTRIAFRSNRSGHNDIWIMGANGTGQTNLTNDFLPATSNEYGPAWSPDGTRIAYSSDIDTYSMLKLWTMRADGRDKQRVLPATVGTNVIDLEPSWSPDGSRIAFRRIANSGSRITIVTLATRAVSTIPLDGVQMSPSWSPDGALIAFSSSHQNPIADIYTMKPDGSEIVRRTAGGGSEHRSPRWLRTAAPAN